MSNQTKTVKLVKVTDGLYRTENGGVTIMKLFWEAGKPYLVKWTDFMSVRHEQRFKTLAEVKEYLAKY